MRASRFPGNHKIILATEFFNTALESLIDPRHPEIHPAVKAAKDCAAGAVLLPSACAVIVADFAVLVALGVLAWEYARQK